MTHPLARRLAPVVLAAALLLTGCASDDATDTSTAGATTKSGAVASASAELCAGYADVKADAAELGSTPIDTSGTAEEVQQQVDALRAKADKVHDDLATLQRASNYGPAAAAIGAMNEKADALREELALAKAEAQEDLGPKVTAAQEEVQAAFTTFSSAMDKICPAG